MFFECVFSFPSISVVIFEVDHLAFKIVASTATSTGGSVTLFKTQSLS